MGSPTYGERVAALEVEVWALRTEVADMGKKLDDLLALRYKGAGAFWLAATLIGTGIIGAIASFFHVLKP